MLVNYEDISEEILLINNFQYYVVLTKTLINFSNSKNFKG